MEAAVRTALEKFRRGDDETALVELVEMPGDVLTGIIDVFHAEPVPMPGLSWSRPRGSAARRRSCRF